MTTIGKYPESTPKTTQNEGIAQKETVEPKTTMKKIARKVLMKPIFDEAREKGQF